MYDPEPILRVLVRHGVRFVVIGGIAGTLQGSTSITYDLDICYSREPGTCAASRQRFRSSTLDCAESTRRSLSNSMLDRFGRV